MGFQPSRTWFLAVWDEFELPSHSPRRIFAKGGGGGALGSHLWTSLGVGFDYSGTPVTSRVGILTYNHPPHTPPPQKNVYVLID